MNKITPALLKEHNLTQEEFTKICSLLQREPNLVELGIFSVMWSEHCSYKSSRALLGTLPTKADWVIQGPGENAGVIDIGDNDALVFKMESHNHPSFIEPFQGAATGVGGILRDVFTMGARPIANLNLLRFGAYDHPKTAYLIDGVVSGIAFYGNCMGVPTVGGETVFDESYNGNILVNAMNVGLAKKDRIFLGKAAGVGNPIFYLGSKTGRDGIHGATMASDSFDETAEQKRPTVQVGDPFTEKRLLEACLELMQEDLIIGIQDMGAAGLTSSSFEMADRAGTGIRLDLSKVPLREEGMTPYEIMLSESQERMLLVCVPGAYPKIKAIFDKWDLDACQIGEVIEEPRYQAYFNNEKVIDLPVDAVVENAPKYLRPTERPAYLDKKQSDVLIDDPSPKQMEAQFYELIEHPNFAAKNWIFEQYDHQVMTQTITGPGSDASVVRIKGTKKAIAITTNCNQLYCYLDPNLGSQHTVCESGRNLVCSGAKPLALTDCLNFGNPEKPEIMWQIKEAIEGMGVAAKAMKTPVVSGNVSLYNQTNENAIDPTPAIGMVGIIDDAKKRCSSFFQNEDDLIYLIGFFEPTLGASEYLNIIHKQKTGKPPKLSLTNEKALWDFLLHFQKETGFASMHDLSQGGLLVSLFESCLNPKQNWQAQITIDSLYIQNLSTTLFGETASCILASVKPTHQKIFEGEAKSSKMPIKLLGHVSLGDKLQIEQKNETVLEIDFMKAFDFWQKGLTKKVFYQKD